MRGLSEIDEALAAFGKSAEELSEVARRARAMAGDLAAVDEALAALAEGLDVRPPSIDDAPAPGSDIAGMSVDELFADTGADAGGTAALSGLFDDEPMTLTESEAGLDLAEQGLADALEDAGLADALEGDRSGEGGLADALEGGDHGGDDDVIVGPAPASEPPSPFEPPSDLHDLADELEPRPSERPVEIEPAAAFGEPETQVTEGLPSVEVDIDVAEPRPRTIPPPLPDEASQPRPIAPEALMGFDEDDADESTHVLTGAELAAMTGAAGNSDEFELLVDEEVLELDEDEIEMIDGGEDDDGGDDGGGGLISAIFSGRKKR